MNPSSRRPRCGRERSIRAGRPSSGPGSGRPGRGRSARAGPGPPRCRGRPERSRGARPGGIRSISAAAAAYTSPASSRPAASSSIRGSETAATTTRCLRSSGPSTGTRPSVIAASSSPVRITTSERWDDPLGDLGDQLAVVGLDQHRLDRGHRVDEGGQDLGRRLAQHAGPDLAVDDQQVDPVAGPGGQRGEQQGGVHRVVELAAGRRPGRPRCGRSRARSARAGRARAARS